MGASMEMSIMLARLLLLLLEGPFIIPEDITLTGMSVVVCPSTHGALTVVCEIDFFRELPGVQL